MKRCDNILSAKNLSIHDFQPLTLEDKPIFDEYQKKYPPIHSDNLFTTMISWMEYAQYHYTLLEDKLIIMTKTRNRIQFRPPLGKQDEYTIHQVLNLAKKEGSAKPLGFIGEKTKELISKKYPKLRLTPDRKNFDYVYTASDLAKLSGSKYRKIRNRLNKFKRKYKYNLENISEENIDEIHKFLKRWCLWKDCESDPLLENEKKAILYSMEHFFELDLSGIAMYIDGKIESISAFEKMNDDTAVIHYEKASPDYDGIYKAINAEAAKILQKDFVFINRESDMGISGLRKAKKSYRPHHMVKVYQLHRKNMS